MPRFIATMDSSDFCAAFAPQTSQVHNATFQTRRPSMPRHAFRAANRLRRFFSASRILRRWPHGSLGVTRLNGKGSLTLRLTCLSDRASTVGSPLPPPVFLTDCRFLVSTNSFHFVSSIALLGAPKFPSFKGCQTGLNLPPLRPRAGRLQQDSPLYILADSVAMKSLESPLDVRLTIWLWQMQPSPPC